jgi:hypothetical protein
VFIASARLAPRAGRFGVWGLLADARAYTFGAMNYRPMRCLLPDPRELTPTGAAGTHKLAPETPDRNTWRSLRTIARATYGLGEAARRRGG